MSAPDDFSRGRVKILDFGLAKHLTHRCRSKKRTQRRQFPLLRAKACWSGL
jgi:hypothetical protein